jgi:DNA-binding MarR family transcriptional regulator
MITDTSTARPPADSNDAIQAQLWQALAALDLAAIQHLRTVRKRLQVGDEELSVLLYLAHHGSALQRDIRRATSLSRSGAGALVQRLEDRGYVQRRTDPADRRLRLVELSSASLAHIHREYGEVQTRLDRALAGTSPEQISRLLDGLETAVRRIEPDQRPMRANPPVQDPIWRNWG